jgi:putative spermidine/putrescine transport system permease protein
MTGEPRSERIARTLIRVFAWTVLIFLVAPLIIIVPLSFNAGAFFTLTPEMLRLEPAAFSTRWYEMVLDSPRWREAVANSFIVGLSATAIATVLGTLAAMALVRPAMPMRGLVNALALAPLITPIVIAAVGMKFFYAELGLTETYLGLIVAHAVLGIPFVVITVTAAMANYDANLTRAALSLGATPVSAFFRVTMPLILPGIVSGAVFAFATSFDEVVTALFLWSAEFTIPRQMWSGLKQDINPSILAAATMLIVFATAMLLVVEWLRRRGERLTAAR